MNLASFLCKNSAGHFCLNGQFFMWKESSDNVLLNKTGLFHDSLHLFLSLCVSQLLSSLHQECTMEAVQSRKNNAGNSHAYDKMLNKNKYILQKVLIVSILGLIFHST